MLSFGDLKFLAARFARSFLLGAALLVGSSVVSGNSADLLLGNPSNATDNPANKDNFLMVKPYFTLSYNGSKGIPNWVSWSLTAEDIGKVTRVNDFHPDPDLPSGFVVVKPSDYTNTGFDQGHMCNFKDRSATAETAQATFVMSNMIPQAPFVNEHLWEGLEEYSRILAQTHHHLYIIAGPSGQGGVGKHGLRQAIGPGGADLVPAINWKVIAVVDDSPGDDLKKINAQTRLIAIIMPNVETDRTPWWESRVSVNQVEKLTGYTFFSNVKASIITPLKAGVDSVDISGYKAHLKAENPPAN